MVIVCQKMTPARISTPTAMSVSKVATPRFAAPVPSVPPVVMSAQPEFLEDAFDAGGLFVEEFLVFVAQQRDLRPVARLAGLVPLRGRGHLFDQRQHRLPVGRIDAGR